MQGALAVFEIPTWAFALVLAAFAPFGARAWGQWVDRRARAHTTKTLALLPLVVDFAAENLPSSHTSRLEPLLTEPHESRVPS